jgi:lysophospholipase L1-like esterase
MRTRYNIAILSLAAVLVLARTTAGDEAPKPPAADRWEPDIKSFEDQDRKNPPPVGGNVFVGSSSIRMWKLGASFPKHSVINRGFGGSQLGNSVRYAERIVIPYKPRVVVVYAGDNDLSSGKSPETVVADYRALRDKIHAALPETKIVFVSIKPSPSRWKLHEQALEANRLIREEIEQEKSQVFIDVWTPMLGEDGMPRPELFVKDQLHMNDSGYEIWNRLVEPHLAVRAIKLEEAP